MKECKNCGGQGREVIGEYLVTLDMAIDAGDRSLEGSHFDYEYGMCPVCEGTGIEPEKSPNLKERE